MAVSMHDVVIDALPYVDQGYEEPGAREGALALVEEETRRYRPTKNYLDYLPATDAYVFETEIMKNEFERVANRQPMEMLNMKRYELPAPVSGQKNDYSAWLECVNNSMAQLEHQNLRISNLELLQKYGANAWVYQNRTLERMVAQGQKLLQNLRKQIQEVNWRRKNDQTTAGQEIKHLEEKWEELVRKNFEIETACLHVEYGINTVKQYKEIQSADVSSTTQNTSTSAPAPVPESEAADIETQNDDTSVTDVNSSVTDDISTTEETMETG